MLARPVLLATSVLLARGHVTGTGSAGPRVMVRLRARRSARRPGARTWPCPSVRPPGTWIAGKMLARPVLLARAEPRLTPWPVVVPEM